VNGIFCEGNRIFREENGIFLDVNWIFLSVIFHTVTDITSIILALSRHNMYILTSFIYQTHLCRVCLLLLQDMNREPGQRSLTCGHCAISLQYTFPCLHTKGFSSLWPQPYTAILPRNYRVWSANNKKAWPVLWMKHPLRVVGYWKQCYIAECSLNLQIAEGNLVSQAAIFAQTEPLSGKIRRTNRAQGGGNMEMWISVQDRHQLTFTEPQRWYGCWRPRSVLKVLWVRYKPWPLTLKDMQTEIFRKESVMPPFSSNVSYFEANRYYGPVVQCSICVHYAQDKWFLRPRDWL
jgi:hypothetical protein